MGTSSKTNQSSPFGAGAPGTGKRNAKEKKDWTFWFIVGIVVLFIVIVACVYFVKKYNATSKAYIKIGEHEITQTEFDYYYNTLTNNYLTQNSSSLLFMGIDTSKPLDEQPCIYDTNLSWADYFMQSTVPLLQNVKALCDDAKANNFEYDVTDDYNSYISSIDASIASNGVSEDYYYEQYFGKYATKKRLEPVVKEYLTYQAYYNQLLEDNEATAEDVKAEYEANPEQYDTIDYHLYSIGDNLEDDATDEEIEAALDDAEERANEMLERFENGEDWRELCYEYAIDDAKDNFDPENESDSTAITGGTSQTISANYFDWLSDDSREAGDGMVYRDEDNQACFIIVFDQKTPYDLEADSANIAGTLASTKVTEYIDSLTVNYEVTDLGNHLKYLQDIEETQMGESSDSSGAEDGGEAADSTDTADSSAATDTAAQSDTAAE